MPSFQIASRITAKPCRPALAVEGDTAKNISIKFVDLVFRHELIDLDRVRAFERDRLQLVVGYFDIVAFANLIALDDLCIADRLSGRSGKWLRANHLDGHRLF